MLSGKTFDDPLMVFHESLILRTCTGAGFCAGGFVRMLMREGMPQKYFDAGGDIDVFFHTYAAAELCEEALVLLDKKLRGTGFRCARIPGPGKSTISFLVRGDPGLVSDGRSFKLQIVKRWTGHPIELLERFPLVNQRIATDGRAVWADKRFFATERKDMVEIASINNPWLATHAAKLIEYRGAVNGFTERSKGLFMDWLKLGFDITDERIRSDSEHCLLYGIAS